MCKRERRRETDRMVNRSTDKKIEQDSFCVYVCAKERELKSKRERQKKERDRQRQRKRNRKTEMKRNS